MEGLLSAVHDQQAAVANGFNNSGADALRDIGEQLPHHIMEHHRASKPALMKRVETLAYAHAAAIGSNSNLTADNTTDGNNSTHFENSLDELSGDKSSILPFAPGLEGDHATNATGNNTDVISNSTADQFANATVAEAEEARSAAAARTASDAETRAAERVTEAARSGSPPAVLTSLQRQADAAEDRAAILRVKHAAATVVLARARGDDPAIVNRLIAKQQAAVAACSPAVKARLSPSLRQPAAVVATAAAAGGAATQQQQQQAAVAETAQAAAAGALPLSTAGGAVASAAATGSVGGTVGGAAGSGSAHPTTRVAHQKFQSARAASNVGTPVVRIIPAPPTPPVDVAGVTAGVSSISSALRAVLQQMEAERLQEEGADAATAAAQAAFDQKIRDAADELARAKASGAPPAVLQKLQAKAAQAKTAPRPPPPAPTVAPAAHQYSLSPEALKHAIDSAFRRLMKSAGDAASPDGQMSAREKKVAARRKELEAIAQREQQAQDTIKQAQQMQQRLQRELDMARDQAKMADSKVDSWKAKAAKAQAESEKLQEIMGRMADAEKARRAQVEQALGTAAAAAP